MEDTMERTRGWGGDYDAPIPNYDKDGPLAEEDGPLAEDTTTRDPLLVWAQQCHRLDITTAAAFDLPFTW
jgi:hypothetical protein